MLPDVLFCLIWFCKVPGTPLPASQVPTVGFDVSGGGEPSGLEGIAPAIALAPPIAIEQPNAPPPGVEWNQVAKSSLRFLAVMHAFRWATEPDTRAGGIGLGTGYFRAVGNLHGWADGDPYHVNYLAHPAQGAISGRLLLNHDPQYRSTEFGRSAAYWKGRLRAAAFSWAFSEQFELGLVSEASIGHVQTRFPQQGFVDHVITPSLGLGLMVGEDALDRYAIKPLEGRIQNKWARLLLRSGLNPVRSFTNVMDGKAPWHRDGRKGISTYQPVLEPPRIQLRITETKPLVAPFEFTVASAFRRFDGGECLGGGAEAAYRVTSDWQPVLDVNGCKMLGLTNRLGGDALAYQVGPRWTPSPDGKWSPYVHVLFGGMKVTEEQLFPERATGDEANGFALSAGTGVDYRLNRVLAIRLAGLEYSRTTIANLGGMNFSSGFQVTTGMVLHLGTW